MDALTAVAIATGRMQKMGYVHPRVLTVICTDRRFDVEICHNVTFTVFCELWEGMQTLMFPRVRVWFDGDTDVVFLDQNGQMHYNFNAKPINLEIV